MYYGTLKLDYAINAMNNVYEARAKLQVINV